MFDVTESVKLRFDEVGLSFPFPQRDVHIIAENKDEVLGIDKTLKKF